MIKILSLYFGGLFLIFLELYLPGGILGTIGSLLIVASMVYTYRILPHQAPYLISFQILLVGILVYLWVKEFHRTRWGKRLVLEEEESTGKGYVAQEKDW